MDQLPDVLKEMRQQLGNISQEAFAEMIPMDKKNYVGVENGRKFLTEKQIASICKLTGCKYQDLFDLHEAWEMQNNPKKAQRALSEAKYLPVEQLLSLLAEKVPDAQERARLISEKIGLNNE